MPTQDRYALLLDGAFVIKKLQIQQSGRFPTADEVEQFCSQLAQHQALADLSLLRIFFYHAPPASDVIVNPISRRQLNLANTSIYRSHESLLDRLEMKPNFALRLGETVTHQEWRLGHSAMRNMMANPRTVHAGDLVPNISQKGVDLRIGLDIARLALRQIVSVIVVVTGDSDLIPAFKFARREGIRVYLESMGHGVRRDLKAHADVVL